MIIIDWWQEADAILSILCQDQSFVGAVQQQDTESAARAAFMVLKVCLSRFPLAHGVILHLPLMP